jgi:hypothetical protein
MSPELVLHPLTRAAVSGLMARPSHAVMMTGPSGSGKQSVARAVIVHLLLGQGTEADRLEDHAYYRSVTSADHKAIPIEAIRDLQHFLSLRVPGSAADVVSRAIIIEDAHLMTIEAQNALLKMLEEPPTDTIIILTSPSSDAVLPTIRSRVREIAILAPALDDLTAFFSKEGYQPDDIERALRLSAGLPGLTSALLAQDTEHPMVVATTHARGILQSKSYERLLLVDELSKQKPLCQDILFVLGQMSRMALLRTSDAKAASRWKQIMKASYQAADQLAGNSQPKLVLTNLMLSL